MYICILRIKIREREKEEVKDQEKVIQITQVVPVINFFFIIYFVKILYYYNIIMNPLENKLMAMNKNELHTSINRDIMNSITDKPSLDALSQIYNTPMEKPVLESDNLDTQVNLLGENHNIVSNQFNKVKNEVLNNGNVKKVVSMNVSSNNEELMNELKNGMNLLEQQLENNGYEDLNLNDNNMSLESNISGNDVNVNINNNNVNVNNVVPSPSEEVNNIQLLIKETNNKIKNNMKKINNESLNLHKDIITNYKRNVNDVLSNHLENDNDTILASFRDVMNRGKMNKVFFCIISLKLLIIFLEILSGSYAFPFMLIFLDIT